MNLNPKRLLKYSLLIEFILVLVMGLVIGLAGHESFKDLVLFELFLGAIIGLMNFLIWFLFKNIIPDRFPGKIANQEHITNKSLRSLQIMQVGFIMAILVYWNVVYGRFGVAGTLLVSTGSLHVLTIILYFLGVYTFIAGLIMPKILLKKYPRGLSQGTWYRVFSMFILSDGLFEAVAIYGLLLGILGARWIFVIPFFIAGAIGLILTFPTKARWNNRLGDNKNGPPLANP